MVWSAKSYLLAEVVPRFACPGMRVTRAHTADVLADFCDGDVAPRSRKRSHRLPHAHLRMCIRMRVRAHSCVHESLCLPPKAVFGVLMMRVA